MEEKLRTEEVSSASPDGVAGEERKEREKDERREERNKQKRVNVSLS